MPTIFDFISFLYCVSFAAGAKTIKMKGCFTDMHECNQTECVARGPPRQGNIHFCCCKGSLCNEEQQWMPTTTEATTQGANGFGQLQAVCSHRHTGSCISVSLPHSLSRCVPFLCLPQFRHSIFILFVASFLLHLEAWGWHSHQAPNRRNPKPTTYRDPRNVFSC